MGSFWSGDSRSTDRNFSMPSGPANSSGERLRTTPFAGPVILFQTLAAARWRSLSFKL